ncbi:MAG: Fe(3+) ABC transporter substrate-binding protein [Wenzhouxiangellaceae bacterium]|nr:Fe(3+) ABC transporter substrate-binding protein [Wenzhouxiangellaceae bacterium]
MKPGVSFLQCLLPCLLIAVLALPATADELNLYTARHYDVDQQIYDAFTRATGIEVNVLQGSSDQLVERIRREGIASPADVLITVDAGRLWRAEQAGILQPAVSEFLEQRVPAHLRHPDGLWYGFSQRLRLIYYRKGALDPAKVARYEDLGDPDLGASICIRSSNNIYNQSLIASIIAAHGSEAAQAWARGLVSNMARPPEGGDTDQLRALAAGICDIAVANNYYFRRLAASADPAERAVVEQLGVILPNQDDRGAHVNVGGAGIARHAPNRANAIRFLEFLAADEAQNLFANGNFEYPVVATVAPHAELPAREAIVLDTLAVATLGENNPEAVRVADRAGWR